MVEGGGLEVDWGYLFIYLLSVSCLLFGSQTFADDRDELLPELIKAQKELREKTIECSVHASQLYRVYRKASGSEFQHRKEQLEAELEAVERDIEKVMCWLPAPPSSPPFFWGGGRGDAGGDVEPGTLVLDCCVLPSAARVLLVPLSPRCPFGC